MTLLAKFVLALRLAAAHGPGAAERACDTAWTSGGDGWESCVCSLETYRCQVQGWCDRERAALPLPDPTAAPTPGCE